MSIVIAAHRKRSDSKKRVSSNPRRGLLKTEPGPIGSPDRLVKRPRSNALQNVSWPEWRQGTPKGKALPQNSLYISVRLLGRRCPKGWDDGLVYPFQKDRRRARVEFEGAARQGCTFLSTKTANRWIHSSGKRRAALRSLCTSNRSRGALWLIASSLKMSVRPIRS